LWNSPISHKVKNARLNPIGTGVVDNLKSSLHIWETVYTSLKGVVGNTKTIGKERQNECRRNAKNSI